MSVQCHIPPGKVWRGEDGEGGVEEEKREDERVCTEV